VFCCGWVDKLAPTRVKKAKRDDVVDENKKDLRDIQGSFCQLGVTKAYASIAPSVGQATKQALQSMQVSASMLNLGLPAEIAPTGHSPSQAPHAMQRSVIV